MGPITLFDKSFIQSLSIDESIWFDAFFLTNVCPIFYVETLADLKKTGLKGRNAVDEVRIIASKFPQIHSYPSAYHLDMSLTNLLGYEVPMTGQIPLADAHLVKMGNEMGVVSEESPVSIAFSRWQDGKFFEVEHNIAKVWRDALSNLDFKKGKALLDALGIDTKDCKNLEEARNLGSDIVNTPSLSDEVILIIENLLGIPVEYHTAIRQRYVESNKPTLREFAPYATFVLEVEIFFFASFAAGLISTKVPSNRVDSAYLFYLPFCMVFVSSDKFHKRSANYFLRPNQDFVWGPDLKDAIRWLNSHFSNFPEAEKSKGVVALSKSLPDEAPEMLTNLWNKHLPAWRNSKANESDAKSQPFSKSVEKFELMENTPAYYPDAQSFRYADITSATMKRQINRRRGSWSIVPS